MNEKRVITIIVFVSLCLATIGFFIDTDTRVPNIFTNVFETCMLASVLFAILTITYFVVRGFVNLLLKKLRLKL